MSSRFRETEEQVKEIHRLLDRKIPIAEIARRLHIKSRQTIYNILKQYPTMPEQPRLVQPKYVEEFEKTEGYEKFRQLYAPPKLAQTSYNAGVRIGREGWRILNGKDPFTWTKEDFKTLWNHPNFIDALTSELSYHTAVYLRSWLIAIGKKELVSAKGMKDPDLPMPPKRPKGRKQMWFLEEDEIIALINAIQEPDTLMFFRLGIEGGQRASGNMTISTESISFDQNRVQVFESKLKKKGNPYVTKIFMQCTMDFLRRYITDYGISGEIFKWTQGKYYRSLRSAGTKAGIRKAVSTHILKHTFVTQGGRHGITLDSIVRQTGTDAKTLQDFYSGLGEERQRADILGVDLKYEKWSDWINKLDPVFVKRYNEIKGKYHIVNGLGMKTKAEKPEKSKQKRPIPWNAVDGIIVKENTPEGIREAWKKARALHKQGFSDTEVRTKMGWKK